MSSAANWKPPANWRRSASTWRTGAAWRRFSVMGHFLLGSCNFHLGRMESSKKHLDQALAAFSGGSHPALALFAGPDIGVFCRSYQSQVLWQLGNAGEARAQERRGARARPARFRIRSAWRSPWIMRRCCTSSDGEIERGAGTRGRGGCRLPQTRLRLLPVGGGDSGGLGDGDGRRCGARRGAAPAGAGNIQGLGRGTTPSLLPRPAGRSLRPGGTNGRSPGEYLHRVCVPEQERRGVVGGGFAPHSWRPAAA